MQHLVEAYCGKHAGKTGHNGGSQMGTPIVDLNSLTLKLVAILTKPDTKAYYGQMLAQYNVDRQHRLDHGERLKTANPRAVAGLANLDVGGFAKCMVDRAFGAGRSPKVP